jgi:hypothetical protein
MPLARLVTAFRQLPPTAQAVAVIVAASTLTFALIIGGALTFLA